MNFILISDMKSQLFGGGEGSSIIFWGDFKILSVSIVWEGISGVKKNPVIVWDEILSILTLTDFVSECLSVFSASIIIVHEPLQSLSECSSWLIWWKKVWVEYTKPSFVIPKT